MKNKKSAVTIGTFDGVHKGHRLLISKTIRAAKKNNLKSIIISLEKPVRKVPGLLTTYEEKTEEIKNTGVDEIMVISVPSDILSSSPDEFFDEFLIKHLNISEIICGCDFAFGKNRKGDICWLQKKAAENNVKVEIVKPLKISGSQVSSSLIRTLLEQGDLKTANKMLGRSYSYSGMPFREKGLGKKLGYPTVNLKTSAEKLLPKGIFISLAVQDGKVYPSVTSIGKRPTFNRGPGIVPETHLLDYNGIWKKRKTSVLLLKKIRDEKKFKNAEELQNQISKDIISAKKFFGIKS